MTVPAHSPSARPVTPKAMPADRAQHESSNPFDDQVDAQCLEPMAAQQRALAHGERNRHDHLNGDDGRREHGHVQKVREHRCRGRGTRLRSMPAERGRSAGGGCPSATSDALRSVIPAGTREMTKASPSRAAMEVKPVLDGAATTPPRGNGRGAIGHGADPEHCAARRRRPRQRGGVRGRGCGRSRVPSGPPFAGWGFRAVERRRDPPLAPPRPPGQHPKRCREHLRRPTERANAHRGCGTGDGCNGDAGRHEGAGGNGGEDPPAPAAPGIEQGDEHERDGPADHEEQDEAGHPDEDAGESLALRCRRLGSAATADQCEAPRAATNKPPMSNATGTRCRPGRS